MPESAALGQNDIFIKMLPKIAGGTKEKPNAAIKVKPERKALGRVDKIIYRSRT